MSCDCRGVRDDFIVAFTLYLVCAPWSKVEMCMRSHGSGIPWVPWDSHGNGNRISHGNGNGNGMGM